MDDCPNDSVAKYWVLGLILGLCLIVGMEAYFTHTSRVESPKREPRYGLSEDFLKADKVSIITIDKNSIQEYVVKGDGVVDETQTTLKATKGRIYLKIED